jgi:serine protease Do
MTEVLFRYLRCISPIAAIAVVACAAGLAAAQQPAAAGDANSDPVVDCYDKARGTVSRALAGECQGTIISEDEAKRVREQRIQAVQRAVKTREQPVFTDKRMISIGTGFFVSDGGRVVTNRHVVDQCDALSVETTAGQTASAQVLGVDDTLDIALVQANITTPATAVFQTNETVPAGGSIAVIGYPDQGLTPRKPLMTIGTMAQSDRRRSGDRLAIIADVRRGNSGGPVLDQWGNVVGIVHAKIDTVKNYNETKQVVRNVGFAIRTAAILRFLDKTGTNYRLNALGTPLSADQLFDRARPFVVRVGCWR